MFDVIKRFFNWLVKMGKMAWTYFRKDVSDKLSEAKSLTLKETVDIIGHESVCFFASAAKRFATQQFPAFSKGRAKHFWNSWRLPYESCFRERGINLLELFFQLSKPLLTRLWTGKYPRRVLASLDLTEMMANF